MTRRNPNRTAALAAAVKQTALASSSAEAVAGESGAASDATASSNGALDTIDAGAGGDTRVGGDQATQVALTFPAGMEMVHLLGGDVTIARDDLVAAMALAVAGSPEAWNALSTEAQAGHLADALQAARDQIGAHIALQDQAEGVNLLGVDLASGPDVTALHDPQTGVTTILGQADLAAEPSPSSAPQVSDQDSATELDRTRIEFVAGRFTEADVAEPTFKVSPFLPSVFQLERDVSVSIADLAERAAKRRGLDMTAWNELDLGEIEEALSYEGFMLDRAVDWPFSADDGVIVVTASSRDGQPYRRCGYVWTSAAQDQAVHPLVVARLKADPFIVVQAARVAEDADED